jgi:tetratricopeptide (TPR) repeat protein
VKKIYFALFFISLLAFIFSVGSLYSKEIHNSPDKSNLQELSSKNAKWEELYFKANQYYKDGKYENALNAYNEVFEAGRTGGDLFYNMGNACYRLNMIGHAILNYERARIFIPRDADLDYNLRFTKKLTKDNVENTPGVFYNLFFWTRSITLTETFLMFAIINIFFWASLILRIYTKKEWTYYLPIIFLVIWIVSGLSFGWKYFSVINDNRAVVLPETADVLSGPDAGDTLLFQLHSGTIVTQEREEDDWKLIRLPDNKRGWMKGNTVEKIRGLSNDR